MNDYKDRKQERVDRLHQRATKKRAEAEGQFGRARQLGDQIPMGQPVLIGHHSEKRHRRHLDRIDGAMSKGVEATKQAKELERRAVAAEHNTSISGDSPTKVVSEVRTMGRKRETAPSRAASRIDSPSVMAAP